MLGRVNHRHHHQLFKKSIKKDNDLTEIDDDLDQLVYEGIEYDITKISNDESWLLIDGKQVGKIKKITGEVYFMIRMVKKWL